MKLGTHDYHIEAGDLLERLVIFDDGELRRAVDDSDFHAHTWEDAP